MYIFQRTFLRGLCLFWYCNILCNEFFSDTIKSFTNVRPIIFLQIMRQRDILSGFPRIQFAGTRLYSCCVERRVRNCKSWASCFETQWWPQPMRKPWTLDPGPKAPTIQGHEINKFCLSAFQTSMNAKTILVTPASRHVRTWLEVIGATVKPVTRIWMPNSV